MSKFNAAFWKWFGKSKVVDKHGDPLVVYHGTDVEFSKFDKAKIGSGAGHSGWPGFWFASSRKVTGYGRVVIKAFLKMERPYEIRHAFWPQKLDDFYRSKNRNDGVIIRSGEYGSDYFVVFEPNQIKAIDNDGSWDADDPDIRSNPINFTTLFHGTNGEFVESILEHGIRNPYLTDVEEIAIQYAEAASGGRRSGHLRG